MPCVLPVLSMKALSLESSEKTEKSKLTQWGYFLGVFASFNLFALIIILLKAGGETLGWGFHMQYPWMIALLAFLFVFIALLLLDLVPQVGRFSGIGQSLIKGDQFSSQFFTGILAVVVASPCTAPFMATALGVAMVSNSLVTLVIFNALAIGFALPLSLIYIAPMIAKLVPKPGVWMDTFRQFLAFPMLATVIWLVWIYLQQTSALAQLWLLSGLLLFALAFWLGTKLTSGWSRLFITALGIFAIVSQFGFSAPSSESPQQESKDYLAYDADHLEELINDNQVVLVNMTADWCITCKVNEGVAFQSEKVKTLLASDDVHYMVGDWTLKDPKILTYLQSFERSGVPLYVLYSGLDSIKVLPQILTADIIVEAVNQAIHEVNNETTIN